MPMIEPPNSVLLVVGREQFTPPQSFGGATCVATNDCIAIGVVSVDDLPTRATLGPAVDMSDLVSLGRFEIETEGQVAIRDVYNREYESVGVSPGMVIVEVWGNDDPEPSEVAIQVGSSR